MENLIASPCIKLPEQICIERETAEELHKAIDMLPDRENELRRANFIRWNSD